MIFPGSGVRDPVPSVKSAARSLFSLLKRSQALPASPPFTPGFQLDDAQGFIWPVTRLSFGRYLALQLADMAATLYRRLAEGVFSVAPNRPLVPTADRRGPI